MQSSGMSDRRRHAAPPPDPGDGAAADALALQILNGASQSAAALEQRLLRRGFSADTAEASVMRMREYGYVNDLALAESVAMRRQRNGYGRARIVADLRARRVGVDALNAVVANLDVDGDVARGLDVARHTWRDVPATNDERSRLRRKVAGQLQRRGFGGDVVSAVLRELESPSVRDSSDV